MCFVLAYLCALAALSLNLTMSGKPSVLLRALSSKRVRWMSLGVTPMMLPTFLGFKKNLQG